MSLPSGWRAALLGELVSLQTGPFGSSLHQADYLSGGTPLVNPMHIVAGRIRPNAEHAVSADMLERLAVFRLREGDVIIGRRGEMGRCAVVTKREVGWLCGTGSMVIRCCGALLPEYLQRCLTTREAVDFLGQESVGSTMANLNQKILLGLPINLPPVAEQQRIVDALDEVDPELADAASELVAAKRKLTLYRQSLLKSAVEGTLTAEWRRTNPEHAAGSDLAGARPSELPAAWSWMRVEQMPDMAMSNGRSVPTDEAGAKVLRLTAVRDGRIDLGQFKRGAWSEAEAAAFAVRAGDLLIVRGNGSLSLVGRAGVVPEVHEQVAYPDTLIRLRVSSTLVRPEWLAAVWDSSMVRDHIERRARTSAGIYKISQPDIASALIPVPSLAEQDAALALLSAAAEEAACAEQSVNVALRAAAAQRQNILRAAFSGQLVPQDPNDEPASVLLERLRASRSAAGAPTSARRGRKAKVAA